MTSKARVGALAVLSVWLASQTQANSVEWTIIDLEGQTISNPGGTCLNYEGLSDTIIQNGTIGPCGAYGIAVEDSQNIIIRDVTVGDTGEAGIYLYSDDSVQIAESVIESTESGIVAQASSGIEIRCNTIIDSYGPIPAGQHVQFNNVTGANNRIMCNIGRNTTQQIDPEDAISMYKSRGTAQSPIQIQSNLIVGGGPSESGGGIMLGDAGGAYAQASKNVLIDPGQYGVAVSGGNDMEISENVIFGRRQPFTNVGVYVWNQASSSCNSITVEDNDVNWRNSSGQSNGFWDGGNCGSIAGLSTNNFQAAIDASIEDLPAPECDCQNAGRGAGTQQKSSNDLLLDFGDAGLWERMDDGSWQKINPASPVDITAGDLDGNQNDEPIASFAGLGLFARYNNSIWQTLHNTVPVHFIVVDIDGNGEDDLISDFGIPYGLWARFNDTSGWTKLHDKTAAGLAIGDLDGDGKDEVIASFDGFGLFARSADAIWTKLIGLVPDRFIAADLDGNGMDEIVADFGASSGVWARYNDAGSWSKLHWSQTQGLAGGDLDGDGKDELIASFQGYGLYARYGDSTWTKIHNLVPETFAISDRGDSAMEDLIVDFGAKHGLWKRRDDGVWEKLHSWSPEALIVGSFD